MNSKLLLLTLGLFSMIAGCSNHIGNNSVETDTANMSIPQISELSQIEVEEIVFGIYCGECMENCAMMYRYVNGGDKNSYSVDYSDSYFKSGDITFDNTMIDNFKDNIGEDIISEIPNVFLSQDTPVCSYGCPDCTDGCGIYFEFTRDGKKRKFQIDYDTALLSNDIRDFAELLKHKANLLNGRNGI